MPVQYVKPYVKTNKSDHIDAEAIAESVGRPKMGFVPIERWTAGSAVPASGTGALGDASHSSHEPDSWFAALTWNPFVPGATLYRCGLARDPGRRQRPALQRIARSEELARIRAVPVQGHAQPPFRY